jgi:hypothetical protein
MRGFSLTGFFAQASLVCVCNYLGLFLLGDSFFFTLLASFHADSDVLLLVGDGGTGALSASNSVDQRIRQCVSSLMAFAHCVFICVNNA